MMNNTDYQNLIELLKKTLEFYANQNNYSTYFGSGIETSHGSLAKMQQSRIELDRGYQAQFALKKIKEIFNYNNDMKLEYVEELKKKVENIEDDDIDGLIDVVNQLKNIKNIINDEKE